MKPEIGASLSTNPVESDSSDESQFKTSAEIKALPYDSLRNISCPTDKKNGRKYLTGQCPVRSVLGFSTNKNVRDYLPEAPGKKRRTYTQVHHSIARSLRDNPDDFNVLSGGVTFVAYDAEVDESNKTAKLSMSSIINGSQSQGVIQDVLDELAAKGLDPDEAYIRYEIIVTRDEGLITEIAISRNFQNNVATVAILGTRGKFNELEEAMRSETAGLRLKKRQTDLSDDFAETERLLQLLWALVPGELWLNPKETDNPNKVFTYVQQSRCLKSFEVVYDRAHNSGDLENGKYKALYQFFLDMGATALHLYEHWQANQAFRGSGLKKGIERKPDGTIIRVSDGILFPIIAAHSAFVTVDSGKWRMEIPETISDADLVASAKTVFMEIADSNPNTMGKSKACYSQLLELTKLHRRFADMRIAAEPAIA